MVAATSLSVTAKWRPRGKFLALLNGHKHWGLDQAITTCNETSDWLYGLSGRLLTRSGAGQSLRRVHSREAGIGRHLIGLSFWHVLGLVGQLVVQGMARPSLVITRSVQRKNPPQGRHPAVNGLEAGGTRAFGYWASL